MNRLAIFAAFALAASSPLAAQQTMFPAVRGMKHMVGAANNQEVESGFRILSQGGNAVDAGVAATLTAAVTEQSRVGLGGEIPILIQLAGKPPIAISGIGTAPKLATADWYANRKAEVWETGNRKPPIPGQGIHAAILPGLLDGVLVALSKYGTMSFAQVAQPAIEYAKDFPIAEEFARMLGSQGFEQTLSLWPASYSFFYPTKRAPKPGDVVHMPDLAKTLEALVAAEKKAKGNRAAKIQAVHDLFYKGDLAKRFAKFSEANEGLIRYEDMAGFKAEVDATRSTTYRGYEIHKTGFWAQGPVMLQALNILEGYDLKAMGHNSPQYLHTVIEAVKLAFADRDRHYGDPKFSKIPEDMLLSKSYAAERRKLIDPKSASMESRPGLGTEPMSPTTGTSVNIQDTTCVTAVDSQGNAFVATPSGAWLPSVIAGDTGIPISTRLQSFVVTPGHANLLAPGKRPRVTLSPTLVTKDGKLNFVMSTPGGDNQDQAMLQVLLNMIEFGMNPQEAAEAPRFQSAHFYSSFDFHEFTPGRLNVESRISKEVSDALAAMGHKVMRSGDWSNGSAPTVILQKDGALHGAADPRRARFIFGR